MNSTQLKLPLQKEKKMDAFERAHFLFSEKNQCTIGIIAILSSPLPFDRLKEGVHALTKRSRLLRSGIEACSCTFKETPLLPQVSLIKKEEGEDWKSILNVEINQPFVPLSAPLFRVSYYLGKGQNAVTVSMHHAIGDGTTLLFILQEILTSALTYPSPTRTPFDQTVSIEKLVLKEVETASSIQEKKDSPTPNRDIVPTECIYRTCNPHLTTQFLRKIRREGLTFQSAFSALVLKEFFRQKKSEQVEYVCPINIRPLLGLPDSTLGCQITLLSLLIDREKSAAFLLSQFIHSKLKALINERRTLLKNIAALFSTSALRPIHPLPRIGVSNLGPVQFPNFLNPIGIESIYANGSLGNTFALHPVVCTFQKKLHIAFCFSPTFFSFEEAESLCDQIIDSIR